MLFRLSIAFFLSLLIIAGCAKDSNPAVPGAPKGDVVTTVNRNPQVRVGLLSFTPLKHVYVSITRGTYACYAGEGLEQLTSGTAGMAIEFTGGTSSIEQGGGSDSGSTAPDNPANTQAGNKLIRVEPTGGVESGHIMIGPTPEHLVSYRGKIRLILEGKNIVAVNEVPLEDYLLGVVPAEMDPAWPVEALKAQAVASRTYAIFNLNRYGTRGFDLADDVRSQKYGGLDVESDATTNAVIATTDEVVTYENKLACVVFHEESGGYTASNLDVWPHSGVVPYLGGISDKLGVVDFSAGGKYKQWESVTTFTELLKALNRDGETWVGDYFSSISILGMSDSGRIQLVDVAGEKEEIITAMELARILNRNISDDFMPSNMFKISVEANGYKFTGSGKGHGVGMSQWGAHERALGDQGYQFILTQYFPGTEVKSMGVDGVEVVHNTSIDQIH